MSDNESVPENLFIRHFELYCGIILAIFAAAWEPLVLAWMSAIGVFGSFLVLNLVLTAIR